MVTPNPVHPFVDTILSDADVKNAILTVLTAQGDILFRDATGLQRLAAGTSGKYLKTQGAGANPMWDTPAGAAGFAQGFKLRKSAWQSVTTSTYTKVTFVVGDQDFDLASEFDFTNERFVASVAGYYIFVGNMTFNMSQANKKVIARFKKNGSFEGEGFRGVTSDGSQYVGGSASAIYYLAVNDYVEVFVWHNDGFTRSVIGDFMGWRLY